MVDIALAILAATLGVFLLGLLAPSLYYGGQKNEGYSLFFLGIFFTAMSLGFTYRCGTSNLKTFDDLKTNEIYEVASSVPEKGKWAVILRNQDGNLLAYILTQNPPKVFKKTNDRKNPYQPYPPAQ